MLDGIIFDLDGTLWDSTHVGAKAWSAAAQKEGQEEDISAEKLKSLYGLPTAVIAEKLFPNTRESTRERIMLNSNDLQNKELAKNGGILYPSVKETLLTLKETYRLFIVSNCLEGYIQTFIQGHKLEGIFSDFEYPGRTNLPKGENIKLVMDRNNIEKTFYVGDTVGDEKAAKEANIPFVYASYGFGESEQYDFRLNIFKDIFDIPLLKG